MNWSCTQPLTYCLSLSFLGVCVKSTDMSRSVKAELHPSKNRLLLVLISLRTGTKRGSSKLESESIVPFRSEGELAFALRGLAWWFWISGAGLQQGRGQRARLVRRRTRSVAGSLRVTMHGRNRSRGVVVGVRVGEGVVVVAAVDTVAGLTGLSLPLCLRLCLCLSLFSVLFLLQLLRVNIFSALIFEMYNVIM